MVHNRIVQIGSYALALVCIISASFMDRPIFQQKKAIIKLNPTNQQLDISDQTPAIIVAAENWAGPIRPVIINILWYRLQEMQQEGQFYEANTLSTWLTKMLPRYPRVWDFHAWNMAYNISVTTDTPQERWDWVNKGIRMLRQEAIPLNPNAVFLYEKLSFFFFHKIGKFSDDMHHHYKREFLGEWNEVAGAPPINTSTKDVIEWFRLIADSPETWEELKAKTPDIQPLLDQLHRLDYSPTEHQRMLRALARARIFRGAVIDPLIATTKKKKSISEGFYDTRLGGLIANPKNKATLDKLIAFLRKKTIEQDYKMDTQYMLWIMEEYHLPLDWRHPMAHGFYFAERGIHIAGGLRSGRNVDLLNTLRRRLHAIQELSWSGQIMYDPVIAAYDADYVPLFMRDPRYTDSYLEIISDGRKKLEQAIAEGKYSDDSRTNFKDGHENFLHAAVRDNWDAGNISLAQKYFDILRNPEGEFYTTANGDYRRMYDLPLEKAAEELIENEMKEGITNVRSHIVNQLRQGILHGLARGRPVEFRRRVKRAEMAHTRFSEKEKDQINPNTPIGRQSLGDFKDMVEGVLLNYMARSGFSLSRRRTAWRNMPNEYRLAIYDRMKKELANELAGRSELMQAQVNFEHLFSEPQGIKEYREEQQKKIDEELKKAGKAPK